MAETGLTLSEAMARAVVAYQRGQFHEADRLAHTILAVKADDFDALFLIALANAVQRRFDEALLGFDRALAVRPDHAEALYNRGLTLQRLGRFDEALASYDRTVVLRPDHAAALNNRGNMLHELKRFDEALTGYERALAVRPDYADALHNRGLTLQVLRRFGEALASFDRALAVRPDHAEAHFNRGNVLLTRKQFDEALASYDHAVALRPDHVEAVYNRGVALKDLGRFDEALASFDGALALRPDDVAALNNRGLALNELKRVDEALASFDRALAVRPDHAAALNNRGNMLQKLERYDEALTSYDRAQRARPDYAEAHWNEAVLRLLTGDYERGWSKYEWRWKNPVFETPEPDFWQPLWLGRDSVAGKIILLHSEQGLGDAIQFCRYAPLLAERRAQVLLEVPAALRDLMTSLDGRVQVIGREAGLPAFDLHCPLFSLPLAFETRLETIPSKTPYLRVSQQDAGNWNLRLGSKLRPRVGLAWSGRPAHPNDRNRSTSFECFARLLDVDATFVSLQKEVRPDDRRR
jgi:tetratricopeptide (TPR) repeat protein